MKTAARFVGSLLSIVVLQLLVGIALVEPRITSWGATGREGTMGMPGDRLAPFISSTRAIGIDAPASDVWAWLIQLGADRGGFYSYEFIENPLGYLYRPRARVEPTSHDMKVGRIVRASLDPRASVIDYSWPVVLVDPGRAFVLKGWGCFLLEQIDSEHTRLVVRNHGRPLPTWKDRLGDFVMMPMHYIMERRMLMGIKARAEAGPGPAFSSTADIVWFAGTCLSAIGIVGLLVIERRAVAVLLAGVYGVLWQWVFFILDPTPTYSVTLAVAVVLSAGWLLRARTGRTQRALTAPPPL